MILNNKNTITTPLFSIITVSYNALESIEQTILSVINQNFDDYEYIIIDGGSTDGTVDIIKKYQSKISLWISEPDNGIYDAMNKAIKLSKGEWLIFMNSGDLFYNNLILNKIFFDSLKLNNYDIIYGNTLTKNEKRNINIPISKINYSFFLYNTLCHQSVFFNKSVFFKNGYYNLEYKIISDRDLLFKVFRSKGNFFHFDNIISVWDEEGFTKDNFKLLKKEEKVFINRNYNYLFKSYILIKFQVKYIILTIINLQCFNLNNIINKNQQ